MTEAIAAATKTLLKKLAVDTVLDKKKRNKILLIIGSTAVGLLFLLFAPIAVLLGIGQIESPDISVNFDETDFMSGMSPESQGAMNSIMKAVRQSLIQCMQPDFRSRLSRHSLYIFRTLKAVRLLIFRAMRRCSGMKTMKL